MRGEHRLASIPSALMRGSSPHARGARARPVYEGLVPGIIPACAGSTCLSCSIAGTSRDHPRMRGEHSALLTVYVYVVGSSPHARGALVDGLASLPSQGIIPACAGSTRRFHCARRRCRDHPRMRGEHACSLLPSDFGAGSSPHARGAPMSWPTAKVRAGIIPACAGSTRGWLRRACTR